MLLGYSIITHFDLGYFVLLKFVFRRGISSYHSLAETQQLLSLLSPKCNEILLSG